MRTSIFYIALESGLAGFHFRIHRRFHWKPTAYTGFGRDYSFMSLFWLCFQLTLEYGEPQ